MADEFLSGDEAERILDLQARILYGVKQTLEDVLRRSQPSPYYVMHLNQAVSVLDDLMAKLRRD